MTTETEETEQEKRRRETIIGGYQKAGRRIERADRELKTEQQQERGGDERTATRGDSRRAFGSRRMNPTP